MRPTHATGGFYGGAGHQTNQKSYANELTPEEGSPGRINAPAHTGSFLPADNKRCCLGERQLRRSGLSARWVVAERRPRMTTAHITAARRQGDERQRRNERAYVRQTPRNFRGLGGTFDGRSMTPESKNRKTAVRLSGLSGLSGVLTPPSLKTEGGEGGHARMGRKQTNCGGGSSE